MPLYAYGCLNGHVEEHFIHVAADCGAPTYLCVCGETQAPMLSLGRGLTFFEEGRGRWIRNLGPTPVYVTSHEQHKALMREHKVEWGTPWAVKKSGGWV